MDKTSSLIGFSINNIRIIYSIYQDFTKCFCTDDSKCIEWNFTDEIIHVEKYFLYINFDTVSSLKFEIFYMQEIIIIP